MYIDPTYKHKERVNFNAIVREIITRQTLTYTIES